MKSTLSPIIYAPTGLPEHTLGWEVLDWCSEHLIDESGRPWRFTDEQAHFTVWFYAVDESGEWVYRRGVLRRMKGWGKDPFAVVLATCEWFGPCRFAGWNDYDEPVAMPDRSSWIQVAAARADQAEHVTMSIFPTVIPQSLQNDLRLSLGLQRCWTPSGQRIQSVSTASRGLEGSRSTFVILGETHHWVAANGGHNLAAVIRRNTAKTGGRTLAITNAHMDGEDSVAERDWDAREAPGVLYDSREAPAEIDLKDRDQVIAGVMCARGDSHWVKIERSADEVMDPTSDPADMRRFYHNNVVAGAGRWMDPSTWDAAEVLREIPEPGALITLGFDGSTRRDATALVATELLAGWQWLAGLWERDWNDPNWIVPLDEVRETVRMVRNMFLVTRFYADPSWWEETVSNWESEFTRPDGKPVVAAWYTGGGFKVRMARSVRAYLDAVETRALTHHRSKPFRRHVLAAHKDYLEGSAGEDGLHVIRKTSRASTNSIDAAMAGILSWQARLDSLADGDRDLKRDAPFKILLPEGWDDA